MLGLEAYLIRLAVLIAAISRAAPAPVFREHARAVVVALGRFQKVKGPGRVLPIARFERKKLSADAALQASQTLVNATKIFGGVLAARPWRNLRTIGSKQRIARLRTPTVWTGGLKLPSRRWRVAGRVKSPPLASIAAKV
jgi:hypothetical protein